MTGSLFDDPRYTSGTIFESYLRENPSAPAAAVIRTYLARTGFGGAYAGALYDAARKIEELETAA